MKILNIGSLNLDYVYQVDRFVQPGETRHARTRTVQPGGKGLNQSVALARSGADTWHGGTCGQDSALLLDTLYAAGVHTDWLTPVDAPSGHAIIQVDGAGQNCILLYGGANQCLTMGQVQAMLDRCGQDDIVLLQNETNLVAEIIYAAADRGLRVACNAAPVTDVLQAAPLGKLTWLLVNEVEAAQLAGLSEAAPAAAMDVLHMRYPQTAIVMTLGEAGVWYRDAQLELRLPACKVREIVDTTAAGDTFCGYFLQGAAQGLSVRDCLMRAQAASAIAIGRTGAAGSIPAAQEVEAFLKTQPEISNLT